MTSSLKNFKLILLFGFVISLLCEKSFAENRKANDDPRISIPRIKINERISSEADAFNSRVLVPFSRDAMIGKNRSLAEKQTLRAYNGAPPRIPHPTVEVRAKPLGSECTTCHANGGYVKEYKAFAPITPHQNWTNCRQCHVPIQTDGLFQSNSFVGLPQKELRPRGLSSILPGSPPQIPHPVDFRGNCQSCHTGAAAISRIRTEHPERLNCRQCHVPANADAYVWQRKPL